MVLLYILYCHSWKGPMWVEMHWIWTLINYNMKILQVAFLLLFNYLDSLPKLHKPLLNPHIRCMVRWPRDEERTTGMSINPVVCLQQSFVETSNWNVCWLSLFVCFVCLSFSLFFSLSVYQQHYSQCKEWIAMKFYGMVQEVNEHRIRFW